MSYEVSLGVHQRKKMSYLKAVYSVREKNEIMLLFPGTENHHAKENKSDSERHTLMFSVIC